MIAIDREERWSAGRRSGEEINGAERTVGCGGRRQQVKHCAGLEIFDRQMEGRGLDGARGFRCPAIVQEITRGKAVWAVVPKDTRPSLNGIAGFCGKPPVAYGRCGIYRVVGSAFDQTVEIRWLIKIYQNPTARVNKGFQRNFARRKGPRD